MPKRRRTTQQILNDAQRIMDTAELGYRLFVSGEPTVKLSGLMDVAVYGVSVTCVLQNLRHIEPEFEQWYNQFRTEMKFDPLMKYFWKLRTEILKKGDLRVSSSATIRFNQAVDTSRIPPPPPNVKVKGLFLGDNLGGSGYYIELPDGSIQKFYVDVPSDISKTAFNFPNPPERHLRKPLTDNSVEHLSRLYLDYLQKVVKDAKAKFGSKN